MPTARSVSEILEYHRRSIVALRVLDGAFENLTPTDLLEFPRRRQGFVATLEEMRDELDDEVVLAVVASAERVLRLDFTARLDGNGDAPAVRFAGLENKFDGRVPLEEIVDVWKELAQAAKECGAFKQMYIYRHGLAHGRYFNKSGIHDAEPSTVALVLGEMFKKISLSFGDFPMS